MSVNEIFTIDRILAIIGIGFTGIVAYTIYWVQKKSQKKINEIIKNMNSILKKQEEISRFYEIIRNNRISWLNHHVGGVLKSIKEQYEELYQRVQVYQNDKSEINLRKIMAIGHSTGRILMPQLIGLAERDIEIAKDYISNTYLAAKFQDIIPLIGTEFEIDENYIRYLRSTELADYKGRIKDRINRYIEMIQKENEDIKT